MAGADIAVAGSCSLAAGLYVFDDSNFSVGGSLSATNVTLVFEGTATLTVDGATALTATASSDSPVADELPGVAVLFDSGDDAVFHLGASFNIVGSVYALDATWHTDANDCTIANSCLLTDGSLSVAHTDFANLVVPEVGDGGPGPSPAPAHLSK